MSLYGNFLASTRGSRLSNVNVLLVDPDDRIISILRKVLVSLGFGAIYTARNGHDGLRQLHEKDIDLVITDWDMQPMNGIQFVRTIRRDRTSPNRQVPVIMLTGKAKRPQVEEARDAGINEFLVKPFTARGLCDRIMLVIDQPRDFVLVGDYVGPDRRRRDGPPPGVRNRRTDKKDEKLLVKQDKVVVKQIGAQEITIIDPDRTIREKIGVDVSLDEIFSPENVIRAQRIIHQAKGNYLSWVVNDLNKLDLTFRQLEANPNHEEKDIASMIDVALHIKSQAGVFDYMLASQVAESLYDLGYQRQHFNTRVCQAGRKHVDALYVIFQRNIQGEGGLVGDQLRQSLAALVSTLKE